MLPESQAKPGAAQDSQPKRKLVLFRRRQCLLPTWQGWLLMAGVAVLLFWLVVANAYNFLALSVPTAGGALVVEGWVSDKTMRSVMGEFKNADYQKIYVIGGPLERGSQLSRYRTFAELGRAILLSEGVAPESVIAVPAPDVPQDRTYTSGRALKRYFDLQGKTPERIHLISEGPHARRSRLLLRMALGDGPEISVTAMPPQSYDPKRWWSTSGGFKNVLTEGLAYLYARLLLRAA